MVQLEEQSVVLGESWSVETGSCSPSVIEVPHSKLRC